MPRPAPPHVWRKGEDGDEGDNSRHLNSVWRLLQVVPFDTRQFSCGRKFWLVSCEFSFACLTLELSYNYVASILICLAHPHLPNSLPPRSVMYDALVVRHIVQLELRQTEKGTPITDRVIGTRAPRRCVRIGFSITLQPLT